VDDEPWPPSLARRAPLLRARAARALLDFASGTPCVLAGDFNQGPGSTSSPNPPYTLLTTGKLPTDSPGQPPAREGAWSVELPSHFVSAYKAAKGAEPELTTMATQVDPRNPQPDPPSFVGSIDYIFMNNGSAAAWAVKAVGRLPSLEEAKAACVSYPTADEPSDHLLLWADLSL
jgi:endonuclease/exonuclease/phosphatase family metal-dependent hydrolase